MYTYACIINLFNRFKSPRIYTNEVWRGGFWDKSSRLHNLKYIYLERTLALHTRFRWTKEYDTIGWFIYQMSNQENASIWSVAMFFIWYKINGEKLWPAQVNLQRITWSDYNNIKGMIILILLSNVLYVSTHKDEKLHFILFKRNRPREIFEINWNSKHL